MEAKRTTHRIINDIEEKRCFVCLLWKPLNEYHKEYNLG
ncbi:Hypothetical protein PACV_385 [Pacmanvirus A23]|nr:Hypothetical protein B9W72_gp381 [Pacmanvirus A23]SIP86098.1 Hypothetical protein PACV_385 [Pacmanvirus A23]